MSKNKTNRDLLLRQAEERAPRYTFFTRVLKQLMLPVALISDAICYIMASYTTFDEGPASYLPIALVGTAALDIPMSMAGELACRQLPKGRISRRRWIQVAGLIAVFIVSFIAYLLLLTSQFQEMDSSNLLPIYGRCLLPAITSAACFFTSYEAHPAGLLITPEQTYRIEFFAGYVVSVEDSAWKIGFESDEEFETWIKEAKQRSWFESPLSPAVTDRILSLSTCSYEFDNARFVLHAILVEV